MLNVRRNVIFSAAELLTSLVLMFASYRMVVQLTSIAILGVWSTLFAWLSLVRLGDIGIGVAVTRYVAALDVHKERERVTKLIHTGLLSNVVMYAVLVTALGLFMTWSLPTLVGHEYVRTAAAVLPWMLAGLFTNNVSGVVLGALNGLHVGYQRSILMIVGNCFQLVLVLWLVPTHGLVGWAIAQLVQIILLGLVGWVFVCRALGRFELPYRFSWTVLRDMISFSVTLQFASLVNGLWEPLSKILVSHFGGMHLQGLYDAAFKCVFVARNIAVQMSTATVPALTRYVHEDMERAKDLYNRVYKNVLGLVALLMTGIVAVSPAISFFWFGYLDHTFILAVGLLAIGVAASGWCTPAYNIGLAMARLRGNIIATGSSLCALFLFGGLFGLLNMPTFIIGVVAASMLLSSVMIIAFNEPLLGIHRRIGSLTLPSTG